jgi:hypothetical protein
LGNYGIVRPGARHEKTGEDTRRDTGVSPPALLGLFILISVLDNAKFLFLTCNAEKFPQFAGQSYAILLPSEKSELP